MENLGKTIKSIIELSNENEELLCIGKFNDQNIYLNNNGLTFDSTFIKYKPFPHEFKNIDLFFNRFKDKFDKKIKKPDTKSPTTYGFKEMIEQFVKGKVNNSYVQMFTVIIALRELGFDFTPILDKKGNLDSAAKVNYSRKSITEISSEI